MNIVINAIIAYEKPRGVGRYFNNLLPWLIKLDKGDNQYYIYYGKWMESYDFLKVESPNVHFIEAKVKNNPILRNIYQATVLAKDCKKYDPDILFLINTLAIVKKPCKLLSTIHDIMEYDFPEKYPFIQRHFRRAVVSHQAKISDRIITDSEYSKNAISNRLGIDKDNIDMIPCSVSMRDRQEIVTPDKYFLFVSETEKAKNLMGLIEAFAVLPEDVKAEYHVEVVGREGNDHARIVQRITELGLGDKIVFHGYLSDEELNNMFLHAYAFVFPSFFEGFGLPVLEAMACNTPVLCSNVSSIPEVGGDAVLTFDPRDPMDLRDQMVKIVKDPDLRSRMVEEGYTRACQFTEENTARKTLDVINSMGQ